LQWPSTCMTVKNQFTSNGNGNGNCPGPGFVGDSIGLDKVLAKMQDFHARVGG
jgi:hypothetical protein